MIGKILSWNVRDCNDSKKRMVIRRCLSKWKLDVVGIQESKFECCGNAIAKSLWSVRDVGWHFILAKGVAGGL